MIRNLVADLLNKRTILTVVFMAATAVIFWSQSRFPQLDAKAGMGNRNSLRGLSFDPLLGIEDDMPWALRVLYTSLNWGHTNWKGMAFGLVLGAALMAFMATLPRGKSTGGVVISTLKGLATGIPLGLCVNCATPIGRGLLAAGARIETALATMFSSPSLNPIVITMLLSLFPLHFAAIKIFLTLFFIVILMPLVCRLLTVHLTDATDELARDTEARSGYKLFTTGHELEQQGAASSREESWSQATLWVARQWINDLWFIVRISIPLMLLAGLFGGLAIESMPEGGLGGIALVIPIVALAAIGTFLPVPVAFDVIFASMLLSAGLPAPMVMTLLITLGLYSVFPFLVIWRQISALLAITFFILIVLIGTLGGYALEHYESRSAAATVAHYTAKMAEGSAVKPTEINDQGAVETASKHCETLGPILGQRCVDTFIFRRVARGASVAICDHLANDKKTACRGQYRFSTVVGAATDARNATLCDQLSDGDESRACINAVVDTLSRDDIGLGVRQCNAARDFESIKQCRFVVVQEWVRVRGDPTLCSYLELPAEIDGCENFTHAAQAALNNNPAACASLPPESKKYCLAQIDLALVNTASQGNVGACDALRRTTLRNQCKLERGERLARTTGDQAHCADLPKSSQNECLLEATLRRIDLDLARFEADFLVVNSTTSASISKEGFKTIPLPPIKQIILQDDGELRLSQVPLQPRISTGSRQFIQHSGPSRGIDHRDNLTALDQREPFILGRGLASGDFDNDGRDDLVFATREGLRLYRNLGQGRFEGRMINLATSDTPSLFLVAMVDLNNDGWLDVFASSYGGDNFIVFNDRVGFETPDIVTLTNPQVGMAMAAAFGDIDQDGDLDIVLGNWSFGSERSFATPHSKNQIYQNHNGREFSLSSLDGPDGETLTTLLSDLNGDGRAELIVGNDHDRPDIVYSSNQDGGFSQAIAHLGFPRMPFHTMSIDSADFNNDLMLDVFATDMSFSAPETNDYCASLNERDEKKRCQDALDLKDIVKNRRIDQCENLPEEQDQWMCRVGVLMELAIQTTDIQLCERLPNTVETYRSFCRMLATPLPAQDSYRASDHLPQQAKNVLLIARSKGGYEDTTENAGVGESFWSWNAKAADLDNDGWQDIYVGNGYKFDDIHSNVLFHNRDSGSRFVRAESEFGLDDRINTPSYSYIDLDNDGDMDIVATGVNAPVRVYFNPESTNNLMTVSLRDARGNHFGVGAIITIHYGRDGELAQMREIKAGGGFMSFDSSRAHFGLAQTELVHAIEVRWADGSRSQIKRPLKANHGYYIERKQ